MRLSKFMLGIALIVFFAVGFYGCRSADEHSIENVVLITIDTCRADRLGSYGFDKPTSPKIDAVASDGIRFERAFTPVPLTLPAHSSIMTGLLPPSHGVHHNIEYKLGKSNTTLAEILKENGFQTGAVVSSVVLEEKFGLDQGFDSYVGKFEKTFEGDSHAEQKGEITSAKACQWLEDNAGDKPFFMFVHYYDPHDVYQPPQPFSGRFKDDLYAGEIAYTDECIGLVIAKLKELGEYDSTLIIITADHGEMLGEHGEQTHGYFIYNASMHVPLIIRMPGVKPGTVSSPVSLIDIAPTVLALLGIEADCGMQGRDLSPRLRGEMPEDARRMLYAESMLATEYNCNPLLAVTDWPWKYIYTSRPELYDLANDPEEANNLAGSEEQLCGKYRRSLSSLLDSALKSKTMDNRLKLDDSSLKQLQSLGYVGENASESFNLDEALGDPKDFIALHEKKKILLGAVAAKEYTAARRICDDMLKMRDNIPFVRELAARIAAGQKRYADAADHYKRYLQLTPSDIDAAYNLGVALQRCGKHEQAIAEWKGVLSKGEREYDSHCNIASSYYQLHNVEGAVEHWKAAVKLQPDSPGLLNNLAWLLATGPNEIFDPAAAVNYAKKACELSGHSEASYLDSLAVALAAAGEFDQAGEIASKAIRLAQSQGDGELAASIKERMQSFRQGERWIEP